VAFIEFDVIELRLVENAAGVMIAVRIFIADAFYLR
jgi:hypothetical protein